MDSIQKEWEQLFNKYRLIWVTSMEKETLDFFTSIKPLHAYSEYQGDGFWEYYLVCENGKLKITTGFSRSTKCVSFLFNDRKLFQIEVNPGGFILPKIHKFKDLEIAADFFVKETENIIVLIKHSIEKQGEKTMDEFKENFSGLTIKEIISDRSGVFFLLSDGKKIPADGAYKDFYEEKYNCVLD